MCIILANCIWGGDGRNSESPLNGERDKPRFQNVDILKGLAILLVVWSHTDSYGSEMWNNGTFGNITFFFLSGFFFKVNAPFSEFMTKRVWHILLPFMLFYLLSIPFQFVVDLWDNRSLTAFDWNRIWDILKVQARSDYLSLNVPLWFLLTIFWIQVFGFFIMRLPKWSVLILGIAIIFLRFLWSSWATPFMITNACSNFGYFAVGYVVGKPLLRLLQENKWRVIVMIVGTVTAFLMYLLTDSIPKPKNCGFLSSYYISISLSLLALSSFIMDWKIGMLLKFYGVSSLFILGSHDFILIPLRRISYMLTRMYDPLLGLAMVILTAALLVPIIRFANNRCPMLTGAWSPVKSSQAVRKLEEC